MTAVCASSLHSLQVRTYSQSCYQLIHTLFDLPPIFFVCLLDLRAGLTRNLYYTTGFPDGRYRTSQKLTLIGKTNMICRLCIYNCTLLRQKSRGLEFHISRSGSDVTYTSHYSSRS
jgi:hypothetical protein